MLHFWYCAFPRTPLVYPVVALCHRDPVALDLQVWPLHTLQRFIDDTDVRVASGPGSGPEWYLSAFLHHHHLGELSSTAGCLTQWSRQQRANQFCSHALGSSSPALTPPVPGLLFCSGEVQVSLPEVLQGGTGPALQPAWGWQGVGEEFFSHPCHHLAYKG